MITKKFVGCTILCVASLSILIYTKAGVVRGQSNASPTDPGTDTLLNEVRQLRLAIQRSNLSTFRTQLILERLRIQTARVETLHDLIERTREETANAKYNRPRTIDRLKELETEIPAERNEARRKELISEQRDLKYSLEQMADMEQRQLEKENQLTTQLQSEQAKLDETNAKLDSIDRDIQAQWPEDRKRPN